jgi:hypothetical protein
MTNHYRGQTRSLAVLAGIVALALIAAAFFHLCLHSIELNEAAGSNHHCLLCTVFGHTILSFNPSDFLPTPTTANRPLLLMPVLGGEPSVQTSVAVRAPPCLEWN